MPLVIGVPEGWCVPCYQAYFPQDPPKPESKHAIWLYCYSGGNIPLCDTCLTDWKAEARWVETMRPYRVTPLYGTVA